MSHNVCQNCWGENDAGAVGEGANCRHCGQPLLLAAEIEATGEAPDDGGGNSARWVLVGVIFALALGSVLYRLLVWSRLEQTSALFIGLPAALAVAVALLPRAKSSTGMIMKVMTLALLMSGILLGEGFICILMAAPLFYLVGYIIGLVMDRDKRNEAENRRTYGLLALPLIALFSLEGVHRDLSFPRAEVVGVSRTVAADAASVERALGDEPRFEKTLPLYLRLGFPKPVAADGHGLRVGDRRTIRFAGGEGKPGELTLEVAEAQAGRVLFRALSDTSHISHWLDWKEAEVVWTPRGDGRTDVRWTLRYDRRLDPAWYFAPWERYAVRLAAGYLIETLATPDTAASRTARVEK